MFQSLGYSLDTKGSRFDSIPEMLEYYYHNGLPNTKGKLRFPYVESL